MSEIAPAAIEQVTPEPQAGYVTPVIRRYLWERESAICAEIEKRVRANTRSEARAAGREGVAEMLSEARSGEMLVGAEWHPEGFEGARHYLACWAPSVLKKLYDVLDRELDAEWEGDEGFWVRAVEVAQAAYVSQLEAISDRGR